MSRSWRGKALSGEAALSPALNPNQAPDPFPRVNLPSFPVPVTTALLAAVPFVADKDAQRAIPHALVPAMLADPGIVEIDGTFYCSATTDGMGQGSPDQPFLPLR
jgi:predicted TIM-barrel enzyme